LDSCITDGTPFDATKVTFIIVPRINAAGRLAHAGKAVELLLCESHELASAKAQELIALNTARIEEERRIIAEIEEYMKSAPNVLNERVLVLSGKDWHHGIIGIIASRMVERFGKPCVIVTTDSKTRESKGSFRSPTGFSAVDSLAYCKDLLSKFGGHAGAGGFSLDENAIPDFKKRLQKFAAAEFAESGILPLDEKAADVRPRPETLTVENIEKLEHLQPFGEGNPVPVFCLTQCLIKHKRPLKEGKFVSFTIEYIQGSRNEFKVLEFSRSYVDFWYKVGDVVDIMANIDVNEYNGVKSLSIKVVNMRLSFLPGTQDRFFAAKDTYEKIKRGETDDIDTKLFARIIPTDDHMKKAYNLLKNALCLEEVTQRGLLLKLNYCMLRVIIDIFVESGLMEFDAVTQYIKLLPQPQSGGKADLANAPTLIHLKELASREREEVTV
jgi:single-stranded-DNA-specific exonuclease